MDGTSQIPPFYDEFGNPVPVVNHQTLSEKISELCSEPGLHPRQVIEAAAFGLSMVMRVALGLDSDRASVGILFTNSLAGAVSLASARHLANNGAKIHLLYINPDDADGPDSTHNSSQLSQLDLTEAFESELNVASKLAFECSTIATVEDIAVLESLLPQFHAVVAGTAQFMNSSSEASFEKISEKLINTFNNSVTPVHSIFYPLGFSDLSASPLSSPLMSASTLSLGFPLEILKQNIDACGRLYLTDISLPLSLYNSGSTTTESGPSPLFSKQPIIRIVPEIPTQEV